MHVWNVLHTARWKHRMQKLRQKSPYAHHRTTLSGYIFTNKARINNRKNPVKRQHLLHMSSRYGELWPTNGLNLLASLGHPNGFRVLLCNCTDIAKRCSTKLCTMFGRLLHWYTIYTFLGALAPWRNFVSCKIHFASKSCILLYWHHYCTALEHWWQPKFAAWYKEWNYGTFAAGTTYIQQGGHHVGHRPTF